MKKRCLILTVFLLCALLLAGCSCQHEWIDATCTTAKVCSKCDATEGEALEHSWAEASCSAPKTCSVCGLTEGEALAHTWAGTATYQDADTCTVCGSEGDTLTAYFEEHGLTPNVELDTEYDYITRSFQEESVEIIGKFTVSNYRSFPSDDKHPSKDGYEYRAVELNIDFTGGDVYDYGVLATGTVADYYTPNHLVVAENDPIPLCVNYHGTEYSDCTATFENAGFFYDEVIDGMRFQAECVFLVPAGYDGAVLAFYNGTIDVEGMQLHEVEDENMLIFRFA